MKISARRTGVVAPSGGKQEEFAMEHHRKAVHKFTKEDRFFSAIGRFIFEFSQLEYSFKFYIAEEINLKDEHFNAVMTHDFALLCTIAEEVLVPSTSKPASSKLKKLISKCRSLNDERVRIAHGLWYVGQEEGRLFHGPRGRAKDKVHYEKAGEVADLADRANQYRDELTQLVCYMPPVSRPPGSTGMR
jgi:hypothetical protein